MKPVNKLIAVAVMSTLMTACKPGPIYIGSHPTAVTTPSGQVQYVTYNVDKKRSVAVPQSKGSDLITNKITAAYAADPKLNPYKINVSTQRGVVTLTGNVPNSDAKSYAIKVARYTKGVLAVDAKNLVVTGNN